MTLPLSPEELRKYNNVPTTPESQKLGDTINELYAGGGGGDAGVYGEIYGTATFASANVDSGGYKRLNIFTHNGESSGVTLDGESGTITVEGGFRYRLDFQCNIVRNPVPGDVAVTIAFGVDAEAITTAVWGCSDQYPSTLSVNMSVIVSITAESATIDIRGLGEDAAPGADFEFYSPRLRVTRLGPNP